MHYGVMSFSEGAAAFSQQQSVERPFVEVIREGKSVCLDFDLYHFPMAKIYCKRGNEKEYTLISVTSTVPFYDYRENQTKYSERRYYMVVFCNHDEKNIGEPSFVEIKTKGKFKFW